MHTVSIGDVFKDKDTGEVLELHSEIFHRRLFLFKNVFGESFARSLKGLERIGHKIKF